MEAGEGKKALNFGPPFGPHPSSPHAVGPDPSGPHSSGLHPSAPPPFERRPSGPLLLLGLGPYVPHFYHVAHFFLCFLIVSISCHFFENFTVFFLIFCFFFSFFQVGEEGWRLANPKPKLVSCLGKGGGGVTISPN